MVAVDAANNTSDPSNARQRLHDRRHGTERAHERPRDELTQTSVAPLVVASTFDNVGVDHYDVYRDGVLVGTADGTTFNDSGLTQQSPYTYTVAARSTPRASSPAPSAR